MESYVAILVSKKTTEKLETPRMIMNNKAIYIWWTFHCKNNIVQCRKDLHSNLEIDFPFVGGPIDGVHILQFIWIRSCQ